MLTLAQVRKRRLDQEHRTLQIDGEGLRPRFGSELTQRQREGIGGVVDHHVDPAELRDGGVDQTIDGVQLTQMRGDADGLPAAQRLQLLRRRGARDGLATGDDHVGPALDQPLGDGQPHAARAARNYDAAAGEVEERVQRILGQD